MLTTQATERECYRISNPIRAAEYEHEQAWAHYQCVQAECQERVEAVRRRWEAARLRLSALVTDDPDETKASTEDDGEAADVA